VAGAPGTAELPAGWDEPGGDEPGRDEAAGVEAAGVVAGCGAAGAVDGAGAVAGVASPSRRRAGASDRIAGVRFINSLSVPEPLIVGRVEVSMVFSAASSISEVVRPIVVIEPI